MAGATGFSHTTIRRIWTAFGPQPHHSETFKMSSDPLFVDKLRDDVGLYLSPQALLPKGRTNLMQRTLDSDDQGFSQVECNQCQKRNLVFCVKPDIRRPSSGGLAR